MLKQNKNTKFLRLMRDCHPSHKILKYAKQQQKKTTREQMAIHLQQHHKRKVPYMRINLDNNHENLIEQKNDVVWWCVHDCMQFKGIHARPEPPAQNHNPPLLQLQHQMTLASPTTCQPCIGFRRCKVGKRGTVIDDD